MSRRLRVLVVSVFGLAISAFVLPAQASLAACLDAGTCGTCVHAFDCIAMGELECGDVYCCQESGCCPDPGWLQLTCEFCE
jgi:hypothetical protein